MEYTVYLDVFWIVNCFVTVVLWIWVKFFLGKTSTVKRILFAGMVDGTVGTIALWLFFLSWKFLVKKYLLWIVVGTLYIGTVFGMIHIVFHVENRRERKKIFLIYHFAAVVFAGFLKFSPDVGMSVWNLKRSEGTLPIWELVGKSLLFLGALPIICIFFRQKKIADTGCYQIEVERKGQIQQGIGFLDTGNGLRNVFTNEPVVLAEYDFIKPMLSKKEQEQMERVLNWEVGAREVDEKVVCIPYHSIGKDGMLFGIYMDHLRIYQKDRMKDNIHILVGLYTEKLSTKEEYQMILHVDCVE